MDWSPDGGTLAIESEKKIHLWDIATETQRATLEFPNYAGLTVAFHPSSTLLASSGYGAMGESAALGTRFWAGWALSLVGYHWPLGFSQDGRTSSSVRTIN